MYNNFFGLKEKPFKLVPNPEYLFLSKSHEEALAHLNYAISQGDGFVEITGEVGTGKTTLCRAFLEGLEQDVVAAYIFNPKMGPRQLLKTIGDEFGIQYRADSTKDLIDKLNSFLMRQKTKNHRVIIIIDEAQDLSRNVLEQLRLLSNLETNREKLLQIILVGQPELAAMLDSYDLRQIGQRINLRYELSPLNLAETTEYIQYRINVASQRKGIRFEKSAYRHIYRYSHGIPRVINIACDRALLTAFGLGQHRISGAIAKAAVRELANRGRVRRIGAVGPKKAIVFFTVLILTVLVIVFYQSIIGTVADFLNPPGKSSLADTRSDGRKANAVQDAPSADAAVAVTPSQVTDSPPATDAPVVPPPGETSRSQSLLEAIQTIDSRTSRKDALLQALRLWGASPELKPYYDNLDDDRAFFQLSTKSSGLLMHRLETDRALLENLDMPAILEFYSPGADTPVYLTLTKIDGDLYTLSGQKERPPLLVGSREIDAYWSGIAYIPWKNFLSIWGTIPLSSSEDSIIALKMLLTEIGFTDLDLSPAYDTDTRNAVEQLQAKYGIPIDGFVGPLTKIVLYREQNSFEMPRLTGIR